MVRGDAATPTGGTRSRLVWLRGANDDRTWSREDRPRHRPPFCFADRLDKWQNVLLIGNDRRRLTLNAKK
jgi:hypothetical protein